MMLKKLVGAAAVGALAMTTGLAGVAKADLADDVAIMVENLPATVDEVVQGVQAAIDTYTTAQSFVEANAALIAELADALAALTNGTEQFALLGGLGGSLVLGSLSGTYSPILAALDDPSLAGPLLEAITRDLSIILGNVPAAARHALYPYETNQGLMCAVADALRGNITDGLFAPTSVSGCVVQGGGTALLALFENIPFDSISGLASPVGAVALVLLATPIVLDEHFVTLETSLAPVFGPLQVVLGPIADAIDDLAPGA